MMSGQTLAIILAGAAIVIGLLALRELLLDFAEQRFAEDALCDRSYGDWSAVPDDLKSISHARSIRTGGQQ